MKFAPVIFLIALTFPSSKAKDLYEYTKDNVLSKSEFEVAKLLAGFLIDNAAESIKPAIEEKFKHAFTMKWKNSDEFDKYVSAFLSDLDNQVLNGEGKIVLSRSKRRVKYGSKDFYKAIYALYIFINGREEDRSSLKEALIEAVKMDWNDLNEFKIYCDDVAKKIKQQHDNELDY